MLKLIAKTELIFSDVIASTVPWLAPVPTAYSVFRAGYAGLGWPSWVAILGAFAIEGLGVSAANTTMTLYSYEKSRRKTDAPAGDHFFVALLASGLYLIAALVLIGLVEVEGTTGATRFVPVVFPFLGLAAMIILALRSDHRRRVLGIAEEKQLRAVSKNSGRNPKPEKSESVGSARITFEQFLELRKSKRITAKMLIGVYGIPKSTAYDWMKKVE